MRAKSATRGAQVRVYAPHVAYAALCGYSLTCICRLGDAPASLKQGTIPAVSSLMKSFKFNSA